MLREQVQVLTIVRNQRSDKKNSDVTKECSFLLEQIVKAFDLDPKKKYILKYDAKKIVTTKTPIQTALKSSLSFLLVCLKQ